MVLRLSMWWLALVALLCAAVPGTGFLAVPRTCQCARGRRAVPPAAVELHMNKLRGYYTVSEGNGGGWSLFQEAVEGAVFLGNRGARRRFTAGFSSQGPALASPLKVTDREKLLNYMRDLEADHARLKREVENLERLGVYATQSCDIKLKALKKKKLATKDRLAALAKMLDREKLARDSPETAHTQNPKRLGQGACGSVVLGRDISTGEEVAIKFEPVRKGEGSRLAAEFGILRSLKGATGFPVPRYFGTQSIMGEEADFLVMDRLGPSLDDLWWSETGGGGGMAEGTVLTLAAQMLHLLRQLHQRGYVHRDLKPENFLLSNRASSSPLHSQFILHLIDFGIARCASTLP